MILKFKKKAKKLKKKPSIKLPHRTLTEFDLVKYAKSKKIPHIRGVFMRNALPIIGPRKFESAIFNLDNKDGPGTHSVAYKKDDNTFEYFDTIVLVTFDLP